MNPINRILLYFTLTVIVLSLAGGFSKPSAELYRNQVAVLMYHHVHDQDESSSTVTTGLFRGQLTYLQQKGYHFISLADFRRFMHGGSVPDNAVLVTFDDGYKSFYDNAYPILKQLGIPAVNFIVTSDLADPLAPLIPTLSKEEIGEMLRQSPGMYDFQCHTDNLHRMIGNKAALTSVTDDQGNPISGDAYNAKIAADSAACHQKLTELHGKPEAADAYAYPFGVFTKPAVQLVRQAGFQYGFTIVGEMATRASDPMQIPRINAGNPQIQPANLHQIIMRRIETVKR